MVELLKEDRTDFICEKSFDVPNTFQKINIKYPCFDPENAIDKGNQLVQAIQSERQESADNPLRLKIISSLFDKDDIKPEEKDQFKEACKKFTAADYPGQIGNNVNLSLPTDKLKPNFNNYIKLNQKLKDLLGDFHQVCNNPRQKKISKVVR